MEMCNLVGWKRSIKHKYMPIFSIKSKNQDSTVCDAPDELKGVVFFSEPNCNVTRLKTEDCPARHFLTLFECPVSKFVMITDFWSTAAGWSDRYNSLIKQSPSLGANELWPSDFVYSLPWQHQSDDISLQFSEGSGRTLVNDLWVQRSIHIFQNVCYIYF